jgi:hypothetical protein
MYLEPRQWDAAKEKIVKHPGASQMNMWLTGRLQKARQALIELMTRRDISAMKAKELRDHIAGGMLEEAPGPAKEETTLAVWFRKLMEHRQGRTRALYAQTYKKLQGWLGADFERVEFDDIKLHWIEEFAQHLSASNGVNTVAIHMRNLRAVVNYAIDNEVTDTYGFRRYKIKHAATRKRSYSVEELRAIFRHESAEERLQKYLDYFKLTFMLIGINPVDMYGIEKVSGGRIDYIRAKTHRPYSIKVEHETQALLDRYAGGRHVLNYLDNYANYRYFYNVLSQRLKELKGELGLEEMSSYWARHSWATIARKLDIPKETIAEALGHGGHTVTDIYIDTDRSKIDEANRRVLDYVLYGKK